LGALPLMAETVGSARLAPLPPPVPQRPAAQRSTMLERFGPLARLLVHLLFRHVRVRAEAVEHLRQLAQQGTLIYVMRYRSALDYLLVNAVLLREGLPLARFAPGVSTVVFRPLGELLGWLLRRRRRARGGHAACSALVARGESVLLFMRSQAVAGRRRRALAAARLGPQYLRDVVRVAPAAGRRSCRGGWCAGRCCATPSWPGWCAASRPSAVCRAGACGRRRAATSTRWPPTSTASTSASSKPSSTASGRACSPRSRSSASR